MASLTGLRGDAATGEFEFEARPELCVPEMFAFGGATASAVVEAIEATAGQPAAWVTTQFLRRVEPGGTVQLRISKEGGATAPRAVRGGGEGRRRDGGTGVRGDGGTSGGAAGVG